MFWERLQFSKWIVTDTAKRRRGWRRRAAAKCAVLTALPALPMLSASPAQASPVSVSSGNSTITVDPTAGMTGWTLNSVQQLNTQQFFYAIGSTGPTALASNAAPAPTVNNAAGSIGVNYNNSSFTTSVLYQILGGTSGTNASATLSETLNIQNSSSTNPLNLHFYKYADYNLGGQAAGQTVNILGSPANTIDQFNSLFTVESDAVPQGNSLPPNEIEATASGALLTSLQTSSSLFTLTPNSGAGPGDVNWAVEWDVTVPASGSFQISIPSTIAPVPEPASISLAAGAVSFLALRRRKRAAS